MPQDATKRGLFIAIEGGEGVGKSTQAHLLYEHLRRRFPTVLTKEPAGTKLGEKIKDILYEPSLYPLHPLAELFLFLSARAQHVQEVIKPALLEGRIVISDRFALSSLAYQGFGRGVPLEVIEELNALACEGISPHLIIYIDLPPEEGVRRHPPNTFHAEDILFHRKVREGFLHYARLYPQTIKVVRGEKSVEEIHEEIKGIVEELIRRWKDEAPHNCGP